MVRWAEHGFFNRPCQNHTKQDRTYDEQEELHYPREVGVILLSGIAKASLDKHVPQINRVGVGPKRGQACWHTVVPDLAGGKQAGHHYPAEREIVRRVTQG